MSREPLSSDSIRLATENKSEFSGHGQSRGVAGYKDMGNPALDPDTYVTLANKTRTIPVPQGGFGPITLSLSWEREVVKNTSFFARFFMPQRRVPVDLDLGCFYELYDGTRGSLQAFGKLFGASDVPPYIRHTGDERTGDRAGPDEALIINGAQWSQIKRLMVYAYVYQGPCNWARIMPTLKLQVTNELPVTIVPNAATHRMPLCALAMIEHVNGGLHCTNISEYYTSHPAMDRAFGFGLTWEEGKKT